MHGPRKYRRGGGGVQAHQPQVFFSHQLNLRFFLKKTIIFQDSREGPTFSGGGGGSNFTPGWGSTYKNPNNLWFSWGWVRTPFPLWILAWKLTLQMFCSWFEDVHVMCFGHYHQIIFSVTFLWTCDPIIGWYLHFRYDFDAPRIWSRVWGVGNCWGVCPLCYNDVTSFAF